jgi:hypothetical protein
MVDRSAIGKTFAPVTATVEAGRLRFFLNTIDEQNPAFRSEESLPPTYLFCLEMMDAPNFFSFFTELDLEIGQVLHVGQSFEYLAPVKTGDRLTYRTAVDDVVDKKGGALTFVDQVTEVTNQDGVRVATMRRSIVVRNSTAAV